MKYFSLLILLFASVCLAQISPPYSGGGSSPITPTQITFPDGSIQVSAAYVTPGIVISPTCPSGSTTCVKIYGDAQYVIDATSNSTTTVTCPNNDCNFTQADVGKVVWATTQGATAHAGLYNSTTLVCGQTTISAVNSAQSITLNSACTASGTANVVLIWGHDDGATLAAISPGCNVVHFATANTYIMTGQPFLNAAPTGCNLALSQSTGAPRPSLVADGYGASQALFILTPNFVWGNCGVVAGAHASKVCIGGAMRALANFGVWATGLTSAANTNCANGANMAVVSGNAGSGVIYGVNVNGVCPGQSGMEGVEVNNADENFDLGGAQDVGQYACYAYAASQINLRANDCINPDVSGGYGLYINGAQVASWSSIPLGTTYITGTNGTLSSLFSTFNPVGGSASIEVTNGAKFISYNDTVNIQLNIDSGGTVFSSNTKFTSGITNSPGGFFINNGGTSYNPASIPGGTGNWSGVGVLTGKCTGTLTSSSTIGLYGLGQFTTPACTSTTVNAGIIQQRVPLTGSVSYLVCNATHAGVNASSGVVTVLKNGSATAITCTIGTGTSCFDVSHTDTPAANDIYSIQVTSQASEVLAGVSCTLLDF